MPFDCSSSCSLLFYYFLEAFNVNVSIGHRRMLLIAAEKLKTPGSKMGISPDIIPAASGIERVVSIGNQEAGKTFLFIVSSGYTVFVL